MELHLKWLLILLFTIICNKDQSVVISININYENCGGNSNIYSISIDGCDEQRSSNDECVIINKNTINYYLTFSTITITKNLYNNETYRQESNESNVSYNLVGDICSNPSSYNLDNCPLQANHINRLHKSINYRNNFPLNYQLIFDDRYYSNNNNNNNNNQYSQLLICSRIRLRYYDSNYPTTTTTTNNPYHTTNNGTDDFIRQWLEILTRVLMQSEDLANKTETKLRQHHLNTNSNHSNNNPILRTLETQLIQLRMDITSIWLEIRQQIIYSDDRRQFRLFVEQSSDKLWKHGEQLRFTVDVLDEFGWDFHNDSNDWIRKQMLPIIQQLLQRLRSMYGYLDLNHSTNSGDQSKIKEFISIINQYNDYLNDNYLNNNKFDPNYLDSILIYVRFVEDRLFEMETRYYGDNYYHYDDHKHYQSTITTPMTTRRINI